MVLHNNYYRTIKYFNLIQYVYIIIHIYKWSHIYMILILSGPFDIFDGSKILCVEIF